MEQTRGLFCTCEEMESATILMPQAVFCFRSEPKIPEGPEYKKKTINTMSMYGEKLYQLHEASLWL